jgi:hypothetical protein
MYKSSFPFIVIIPEVIAGSSGVIYTLAVYDFSTVAV